MRPLDVEIFPQALCVAGCGKPWEKWCRGCNLVFCSVDADPLKHKCKPPETRPYPACAGKKSVDKPEKAEAPSLGISTPTLAPPTTPDLFGAPPANGVASTAEAH